MHAVAASGVVKMDGLPLRLSSTVISGSSWVDSSRDQAKPRLQRQHLNRLSSLVTGHSERFKIRSIFAQTMDWFLLASITPVLSEATDSARNS